MRDSSKKAEMLFISAFVFYIYFQHDISQNRGYISQIDKDISQSCVHISQNRLNISQTIVFYKFKWCLYPILIIIRELSPVANKSNPSLISSNEMILDNN